MSAVYDCGEQHTRADGLKAAASAVRSGRLVVMPTDTVYGIGADAFDATAVRALLQAKNRGPDMPVGVLVGSWSTVDGLVLGLSQEARTLIEAFWPGDLSIVVSHAPSLHWNLGTTRGTVMLRMPLHPVALELLKDVGPMAVSSANLTGRPAPQDCAAAREMLGDAVAVYLDGGPTPDAVPSAIVDVTGATPKLLRAGAVSEDELRKVVPDLEIPH